MAGAACRVTRAYGLTGGIGSGKSTAARVLGELGAAVIDADAISHALTQPGGAAVPAIRAAFGDAMAPEGGGLDRAALRERVFRDPAARARLEGILHPLIGAEMGRQLEAAHGPYALLVVPLLYETGRLLAGVRAVVVVDCPEALQVSRAGARSGLSADAVRAVMAAQWPRWRRLQAADEVLWNGAGREALDAQCRRLHARLVGS